MIARHIKHPMLTGCQTVLPADSPLPSVQWLIRTAVSLQTDLAPDTMTTTSILTPTTNSHREDWRICSGKNTGSKKLSISTTWPCSNSWTKISSPRAQSDLMRWTLPHRSQDRLWFTEAKSYQWRTSGGPLAVPSDISLKLSQQASSPTRIDRFHLETINTGVNKRKELWPKANPLLYACPRNLLLAQATLTSAEAAVSHRPWEIAREMPWWLHLRITLDWSRDQQEAIIIYQAQSICPEASPASTLVSHQFPSNKSTHL